MYVALGNDHAGFPLRERIISVLQSAGQEVLDCGVCEPTPVDYPDLARKVAETILAGQAERGILLCGSGVGISVAASKIPGIRAGVCHDTYSAHQGVEHDDMNVLCLGSRIIGPELAAELVQAFLAARFTHEERHVRRLGKIAEIERDAMNGRFTQE